MPPRAAKTPPVQLTPDQKVMLVRKDPDALNIVIDPKHPLYQRRAHNDPPAWMIQSAIDHGIITPIKIRKGPVIDGVQTWDVVVGRMRVKSARAANKIRREQGLMGMTVACEEFRGSDEEAQALIAIENEHRVATDPMTRAETAAQAIKFGASEAKVMNDNVWTRAQLDAHLALLNVSPKVQAAVMEGRLQLAAVPKIAKLTRDDQDVQIDKLAASGKTGPREVDNAITADNPGTKVERPAKPARPKPLKPRPEVEAKLKALEKQAEADIGAGANPRVSAKTAGMIRALKWVLGQAIDLEAGSA